MRVKPNESCPLMNASSLRGVASWRSFQASAHADNASLEDYVHTPDECSSHNAGNEHDNEAFLDSVGPVAGKREEEHVFGSAAGGSSKPDRNMCGVSKMVLATSGVSRRLDFSKDRIVKALSVVRSKKDGFKKPVFVTPLCDVDAAGAVPGSFLGRASTSPSHFPSLAPAPCTVISAGKESGINVDDGSGSGKSSLDLLTIADGPSAHDRASLSFVNERRVEFTRMVADFSNGTPVMFIARNIGAWLLHSNTLSVLDCTILVPVRSVRIRDELKSIFSKQIAILGYGKGVYGVLEIVNINTVLMQLVCIDCKSTKVRRTVDGGGHCFACNSAVQVVETPKLDGRITKPDRSFVSVSIVGDVVDKVLDLPVPFKDMYARNVHVHERSLHVWHICFEPH